MIFDTKSDRNRKARRMALTLASSIAMVTAIPAFAQSDETVQPNADQPVAAGDAALVTDSGTLPDDLQPEKLAEPRLSTINPEKAKQIRAASRNRWDPSTLTQTTGLSAASIEQRPSPKKSAERKSVEAGVLGGDLMSAEDLLNVGEIELPEIDAGRADPPREDGVINLGSSLRGALFDLPSDNINASVFELDLGDRLCLGTAEECAANDTTKIDVGYAKNITHGKFDGLNLQLTPRAGLRFDDESKSALVGALVRIGDNLREGSEMKSNTWYFFAGADAEAVTYTPTGVRRLTSGEFHLQDRIIVGDAQAGLGYRIGSADLALTYYKRQAKAENYSYDEDAAALSLTWKR